MRRICTGLVIVLAVAYVLALLLFLIGTLGLFGQETDPLAGVFLMPLGLPWIFWVDALPEPLWPWAAAMAPMINIALLSALCRRLGTSG